MSDRIVVALAVAISALIVRFTSRPHPWLDWLFTRHQVTDAAEHITRQAATQSGLFAVPPPTEEEGPS